MSEKIELYKDYRLRIKDCQDCNSQVDPKTKKPIQDVIHDGKVKAVPGFFHPDKVDILFVFLQPEEEDHKRKQVTLYTGPKGDALMDAMKAAGVYGSTRFGYTSLIKCKLTRGNVKRRVCKRCMDNFFQFELDLLDPKIVVLCGAEVTKFVLPEVLEMDKWSKFYGLEGEAFLALDRWYFFLKDMDDLLTGKKYSPDHQKGDFMLKAHYIGKVASL